MKKTHQSIYSIPGKITFSSFLIFLFIFLNSNVIVAQNTATVSGIIEVPKSATVQMNIDRLHLGKKIESTTKPLTNGQFQFIVNLDQSNLVELIANNIIHKIYLDPGDNLQLQLNDSTIIFNGKGAVQNRFLDKFYTQFANDFNDSVMFPKILSSGVDVFEMAIFDSRKKQNEFYKNDPGKNNFSTGFNSFMQNTISYRYWNLMFAYPIINANSNKGLIVNGLPTIMLDGLIKVQLNNDSALNSESYREFLKYYVIYFTSQANGFNKFNDFSISADKKLSLARERLKGEALKFWLTKFTLDECGRIGPFLIKKLYSLLLEIDKEIKYTPFVKEFCGDQMAMKEEKKKEEKIAGTNGTATTGNDELDLTDVNGKHVSLSDFKGKVVYIDFWASWCGPCRMMMPYSKKLHEQLTDKQKKRIVFLYISIDGDPAGWKKGIEDMGIQGVNVNSPGNWSSKATRYFQINSIPRYMIMNKKGEIVDPNAKRPADPAILDDLLKLVVE